MIELFINNTLVDLPTDFSVEIQYDNPYFTKSSDFSLDVDIPLISTNNRMIFGHINRLDVAKKDITFPCRMRVNQITAFIGDATIIKITPKIVTLQFLGNNSSLNFFSDEIFIDTLELGMVFSHSYPPSNTPGYWEVGTFHDCLFGSIDICDMVLFEQGVSSGDGGATFPAGTITYTNGGGMILRSPEKIPIQPYFVTVINRIITTLGYNLIRNDIDETWMRNIFIVNRSTKDKNNYFNYGGKPAAYMAEALPHWSLNTFLNEVEKFFGVIVIVDDNKNIEIIDLIKYYSNNTDVVYIPDSSVLDDFEVEYNEESDEKNIMNGNVGYNFSYTDKFLKPDPSITLYSNRKEYGFFYQLSEDFNLMTAKEKVQYIFVDLSTHREYYAHKESNSTYSLKEFNIYGDLHREKKTDVDVSLRIVPANVIQYDSEIRESSGGGAVDYIKHNLPICSEIQVRDTDVAAIQTLVEESKTIEQADEGNSDCIEVAISTGEDYQCGTGSNKWPFPFTDHNMPGTLQDKLPLMSLSLKNVCDNSIGNRFWQLRQLDSGKPHYIRFITDKLYKSRCLFIIKNKKYVCRYLKTT